MICGGRTVAALYVETGGCYFDLPGVEPWDQARDARQYAGPWPVVAHPPCQRWGKLWAGQPLWIKRTGERKVKGDDGGCFAAALASVRRWGGVIEHPWGSHAWPHFGLNIPSRSGGWIAAGIDGGWTCCVEQGRYGHYARKPTLLVVFGVDLADLPELEWGIREPKFPQWAIDKHGLAFCKRAGELAFKGGGTDSSARIGTPTAFRDLLLNIARLAQPEQNTAHEATDSYGIDTSDAPATASRAVNGGVVIVDAEDGHWITTHKPRIARPSTHPYVVISLRGKWVSLARTIIDAPKGRIVDHINGNPLDNRRANLRLCSHSENAQNRKVSVRNTSGFKGVSFSPERCSAIKPWAAAIKANGANRFIGFYETAEAAAKAYDDVARQEHGAFAALNFPGPGEQPAHRDRLSLSVEHGEGTNP